MRLNLMDVDCRRCRTNSLFAAVLFSKQVAKENRDMQQFCTLDRTKNTRIGCTSNKPHSSRSMGCGNRTLQSSQVFIPVSAKRMSLYRHDSEVVKREQIINQFNPLRPIPSYRPASGPWH